MRKSQNGFGLPEIIIALALLFLVGVIGYKVFAAGNKNGASNTSQSSNSQKGFYTLQTVSLGNQSLSYEFDPSQQVTKHTGFIDVGGKDLLKRGMVMEIGVSSGKSDGSSNCVNFDRFTEVFSVTVFGLNEPVCSHYFTYSDHPDYYIYLYKNKIYYKVQFISGKSNSLDDNTVKTIAASFQ